ncbi:hypothetical protein ACIBHY_52645 [Nonomuraea sp. NPDC050547]|uniref:hypothetical protein n=1 Tax=Nonomuraea sp. NPDC050547 TaxID=3364368 RepID=UPI0037A20768
MYEEILTRNEDVLGPHYEACELIVTIPDHGILTPEGAIERLGYDPREARTALPNEIRAMGDLAFIQAGTGVVAIDMLDPNGLTQSVTERLGGPGFRHWYMAMELSGRSSLYCRYGDVEGYVTDPDFEDLSDVEWRTRLGPLAPYADLISATFEEDAEFSESAAYLTAIELESGIQFTAELLQNPRLILPETVINWPPV